MIIYFSGTGNSAAVARGLAERLGEPLQALMAVSPLELRFEGRRLIFVFPIYSWGVPPIVLDYIRSLNASFVEECAGRVAVWGVATGGDEVARAPEMFRKCVVGAGLDFRGFCDVIMPNNYVLLPGFSVDPVEVERRKLSEYEKRVDAVAEKILADAPVVDVTVGSWPRLKTGVVYPLFKRWGITPSRWVATDACVGCRKCVEVCPVKNIAMKDRQPVWGDNCMSCCGCYHVCPRNAVQYGRITRGKGQYFFPWNKK